MKKKNIDRKIIKISFWAGLFFALTFGAGGQKAHAQFTFIGDYDRTFAVPNGYYVEPQNNYPQGGNNPNRQTYMVSGDLLPDGSFIAGGRILRADRGDFWLRKFTPSGAVDTSFGGGSGYVRTVFTTDLNGEGNSIPTVVKRQADGKIVFGGTCTLGQPSTAQTVGPGTDFCLVRYNADGSIDTSFGGYALNYGSTPPYLVYGLQPGRAWVKSGIDEDGSLFGSQSELLDMTILSDGKIIVVGYTRSVVNPYFQGVGKFRYEGVIARFNADGTLDLSFGTNGFARWIPPNSGTTDSPCYAPRAFYGVRLQPDGRIIAVGYGGVSDAGCFTGQVFAVTRWSADGTFETARRLDGNTSVFARENAVSAVITNDGRKLLVSGAYQGSLAMARFNLSDLTLDSSFGASGVMNYGVPGSSSRLLFVKAVQTDGKILAVDTNFGTAQPVRFNANGAPDNSFGNATFDGINAKGRLNLTANTFNTANAPISVAQILLRPDGRFNLIGYGTANENGNSPRSLVSRNINSLHTGNYSDFTNDGKSEIAVFRASTGEWHQLNSANSAYSATTFGLPTDKLAPADYDGDGRTDIAVFRDGTWFIQQSSNNQIRYAYFGTAGDSPRPGDFDGDGFADIAVFRPADGNWYWINSSTNQFSVVHFGQNGDAPLLGDFDGDGKTDLTVFRGGTWYILRSSDLQTRIEQFGLAGDIPAVGDYDGDGKTDVAVFRSGTWFILRSSDNAVSISNWGTTADRPVAADYDNDGKTDLAIYRGGFWWIQFSGTNSSAVINFGLAGDTPVQTSYLP